MLSGAARQDQSLAFVWEPDGSYKRYVYVISVQPDGKRAALSGADTLQPHRGSFESAVEAGQDGLLGVIVMESDKPEALRDVADKLTLPGAEFDALASRDGWRFDTIWHEMSGPRLTPPIR